MLMATDIIWGDEAGAADSSSTPAAPQWPRALDEPAFEGIIGDIVTAIAPHTEADQAALLVQGLVAFGNAAGHRPHCRADGAAHHLNLMAALVGLTSKGR